MVIAWPGIQGWLYTVQFAPSMGQPWNDLPGCIDVMGTNGTMRCLDTSAAGNPTRYYRVLMY